MDSGGRNIYPYEIKREYLIIPSAAAKQQEYPYNFFYNLDLYTNFGYP